MSEIFRMRLCLERFGYIAQVEEERYSLTLKLFALVQERPPTERLIVDAPPAMNRECAYGFRLFVTLGSSVDSMEAGSGDVILACQTPTPNERALAEWTREISKQLRCHLNVPLERFRKADHPIRRLGDVNRRRHISDKPFRARQMESDDATKVQTPATIAAAIRSLEQPQMTQSHLATRIQ